MKDIISGCGWYGKSLVVQFQKGNGMRIIKQLPTWVVFFMLTPAAFSQTNRIKFNNQELYLNGANLAWINFASDVGSATPTDTAAFGNIFVQMHNHGGNAVRWWLHTDGTVTPQFSSADSSVTGPGAHTISDMKKVLDLAWQREIGVNICLWSFDMLKTSSVSLAQNRKLLNDTNFTRKYINNCLIPMVNALQGHPAILSWEIFNEPEGMSNEFGWTNSRVPMSVIQRFVNLCTGAIHRADPHALVTNGAWSFYALTDLPLAKSAIGLSKLSASEKTQVAASFQQKYRSSLTPDEIIQHLEKIANTDALHQNYYRDDRLVSAGNDPQGTLDFYSVHYYSTSTPVSTSPFAHPAVSWNLTKPIVVAEFPMISGKGNPPGIATGILFDTLYQLGYAGALPWSWSDGNFSTHDQMLAGMQSMWDKHQTDVDIVFPSGTINSFKATPALIEKGKSSLLSWTTPSGSVVTLNGVSVHNSDTLTITPDTTTVYKLIARGDVVDSVEVTVKVLLPGTIVFFTANPMNIGVGDSSMLSWHTVSGSIVTLNGIPVAQSDSLIVKPGADSTFKLIASGQVSDTSSVTITIANPLAVNRALHRPVIASSGEIINGAATAQANPVLAVDGNPATRWSSAWADSQWIRIDLGQTFDIRRVVLVWEAAYGKSYRVEVSDDTLNWSQIFSTSSSDGGTDDLTGLSGSGRYVRMYGVKRATQFGFSLFEFEVYGIPGITGVADGQNQQIPLTFNLAQNYPNPFNPSTTIGYSLPKPGQVQLIVYDVLGRQVATLIDEHRSAGVFNVKFNAASLTSGVYFYRLNSGTFTQTKKMLVLK
jgi:hypothetical protein